jgi:hypothetical protein
MLLASCLAAGVAAAAPPPADLTISSITIQGDAPAIVFDHARDQVQPYNLPDAAVAAWKDADGGVNLMIPSFENYRMRGSALHDVRMDTREVFSSEAQAQFIQEAQFDYNDWLISPYTLDGRTVVALTHMEWYACLLNGECTNPSTGVDYTAPSWVTTLTALVSIDGGATWSPQGGGSAHVIANEFGYHWAGTEALRSRLYVTAVNHGNYDQTGLIAHTRVIREGAYYYALGDIIVRDFTHANPRTGLAPVLVTGFIEMRTRDVTDPAGWQIWVAGSQFMPITRASVTATYGRDPYTPVSTSTNFGVFLTTPNPTLGQIVFDTQSGLYILVTPDFSNPGLFYATTRSLARPRWSSATLIGRSDAASARAFVFDPRADRNDPGARPPCSTYARGFQPANYPSLLDATSPGLNFEFFNGQPELYYVVNPAIYPGACAGGNLARDLYRIPLRITYAPAG